MNYYFWLGAAADDPETFLSYQDGVRLALDIIESRNSRASIPKHSKDDITKLFFD